MSTIADTYRATRDAALLAAADPSERPEYRAAMREVAANNERLLSGCAGRPVSTRDGDRIEVKHRYFAGHGWEEETLGGTLEGLKKSSDGTPYGMLRSDAGMGWSCYYRDGEWRHS